MDILGIGKVNVRLMTDGRIVGEAVFTMVGATVEAYASTGEIGITTPPLWIVSGATVENSPVTGIGTTSALALMTTETGESSI
jgi:hypothetical protein